MATELDKRPIGISNAELRNCQNEFAWLWEGVLALGGITLFSAPEKIGKTTLVSLLLDRRRDGGVLLGRPIRPGTTILCSEEDRRLWAARQPPLDFGPNVRYACPDEGRPMRRRWHAFVDQLLNLAEFTFDLLVIDTAVEFLPLDRRRPRTLRWVLSELRVLCGLPMAVLIVNQSRDAHRPLAAFADIVIDMRVPHHLSPRAARVQSAGRPPTRRRIITGVGRYPGTLESVTAELNAEGTDYTLIDTSAEPAAPTLLSTVQELLAASSDPLTQRDLLTRWPGTPPRDDSLSRALARGVETGVLTATGEGTKNDPQRFALAMRGPVPEAGGRP
jgi:hypothetical protein